MKNPMTPAGIEPATFRFVTQYLNRCATADTTIVIPVNEYLHILVSLEVTTINHLPPRKL